MATYDGIRLHVLDGGRILASGSDAAELADDGAYEGRTVNMPCPCFLIRHPLGDLIWDRVIVQHELADLASLPRFPLNLR